MFFNLRQGSLVLDTTWNIYENAGFLLPKFSLMRTDMVGVS